MSNARLAILIVIAAEIMFFTGLVGAYLVYRLSARDWPPPGLPTLPIGITAANTLVLFASLVPMTRALGAIRRDDRVSVNVSSAGYPAGSPASLPLGAITFKGRAQFHDDEKTRHWFYTALSKKLNPDHPAGEKFFWSLLDSPLRTVLSITPVKRIMYNARTAGAHMTGRIEEKDLGPRLPSDAVRMNEERARRGLPPR